MVFALACSPKLPDRAEMAGMKLTIKVYTLITLCSWSMTIHPISSIASVIARAGSRLMARAQGLIE